MKLKKGDLVEVITGEDKGKRGKILEIIKDKEKKQIRLEAANSKMKPMRFKKVIIQGKVRGVIRRFR